MTPEKTMRKVLIELGFSEEETNSKIKEAKLFEKELTDWEPIILDELALLSGEQLKGLKTICWRDGKFRCSCVGINNLDFIEEGGFVKNISWSDNNGEPNLRRIWPLETKFHKLTDDGEWAYGLYKKIKS